MKKVKDTIRVTTKDAFKNAIKAKYETIIIEGQFAQEIASSIRKSDMGNKMSNIAIILGLFFWPALLGGVAGKLLVQEMKKYEIVDMSNESVTIKRK